MKLKLGQVLSVRLLDHSQHNSPSAGSIEIEAIGRFVRQTPTDLVISYWHYADNFGLRDQNCEEFSIVKKAIVKVRKL